MTSAPNRTSACSRGSAHSSPTAPWARKPATAPTPPSARTRPFSPELFDLTIYVIDVAAGEKIPRKGGPGITQSDLFVINKTDLAPPRRRQPLGDGQRHPPHAQEPVPEKHRPTAASKSAVSRRFVELSQQQLNAWLGRRLDELYLPVVMIDGIHFRERVILVALGIDAQGTKHVLGLREGSTEATRVVALLVADLVDCGLDADRMRLWVIDGGKALRKAIVTTFGAKALIQRCQTHKCRNVVEHLPQQQHAGVNRALREAWAMHDAKLAHRRLHNLAGSLQAKHPGAAASLREGLDETLTAQQLGLSDALYRTLRSTHPIENLNGSIARYTRNVKPWRDGAMGLRWGAGALADAATRMRKLRGCAQMKSPLTALAARDPDTVERAKSKGRVASPPRSRHRHAFNRGRGNTGRSGDQQKLKS
jgi:hypothetical protein